MESISLETSSSIEAIVLLGKAMRIFSPLIFISSVACREKRIRKMPPINNKKKKMRQHVSINSNRSSNP